MWPTHTVGPGCFAADSTPPRRWVVKELPSCNVISAPAPAAAVEDEDPHPIHLGYRYCAVPVGSGSRGLLQTQLTSQLIFGLAVWIALWRFCLQA